MTGAGDRWRTLAPAKINVCLYVGRSRPSDGRHRLVSVMQAVGLCDEVRVEAAPRDLLDCPGVDGDNIAAAALAAFRARTGQVEPVAITVAKASPVAAGMAGGSADAGAVLRLLDAHFDTDLSEDELREVAATLGADVPAQVHPGRHLATGAGEVVAAVPASAAYGVVVLPHPEPLSTPAVYREFDRLALARGDQELAQLTGRVREAAGDLPDALVVNDLAAAAISLCPMVAASLQRLREAGAELAVVCGSGPTTLGLTRDVAAAAEVAQRTGPDALAVASLTDPVAVTRT